MGTVQMVFMNSVRLNPNLESISRATRLCHSYKQHQIGQMQRISHGSFAALRPLSNIYPLYSLNSKRLYAVAASRTYDDAITVLNTLQTPHKLLEERFKAGFKISNKENDHLRRCLARVGHSQRDLEKLNIIHVAGTKGKGSTCSYVDSILAQHRKSHDVPQTVGLFTSPHLIAVRERIRINSSPISEYLFAKYFFEVWDALQGGAIEPIQPPFYFKYLTLMSYHVFLRERVDTAIYEVGVGGEYDATNIAESPAVTGITSLGIDHVNTLGETLKEIAWHKAGIQKPGVPSLTVVQPSDAISVIETRARERDVQSLKVVNIDPRLQNVKIRPDANFQRLNASLAIALTETALQKLDPGFKTSLESLPQDFVDGLEQVVWHGRCEKKIEDNIIWHLDGAHTADSIKIACRWFGEECAPTPGTRVLIFNQQGHNRVALPLLESLYFAITSDKLVKFDHVIFCTSAGQREENFNAAIDSTEVSNLSLQNTFAERWRELDPSPSTTIKVLPFIEEVFEYVRNLNPGVGKDGKDDTKKQVLITGSLHLVGRALGVLEGIDAL